MKLILFLAFISLSVSANSQLLDKLLFYDKDWKPVKPKKATYLLEQKYINDTLWEWNYYGNESPRFLSVQFKDEKATIRNGRYKTYNEYGYVDTSGYYSNGKREGKWTVMALNKRLLYELQYRDGVLISRQDSLQLYNDELKRGDSGYRVFSKVEVESEFQGGPSAWVRYMSKNLRYPEEASDNTLGGFVIVQFIVDKEGYVTQVDLHKSVEYYLDKEAIRFISNSPRWTPGMHGGKPVKSYKLQPIYFAPARELP